MSCVRFISKKFNSPRNLPPAIHVMRRTAMIGIAISVAALIIATSIGRGFEKTYRKALFDFNAHVVVMNDTEAFDLKKLKENLDDSVLGVTPFLYREALAIGGGKIKGVVIKGIEPVTVRNVNSMKIDMFDTASIEDALKTPLQNGPLRIVAGSALARELGVDHINNNIRLMIPADSGGKKTTHRFENARVVGLFESGMHDYDVQFLLMEIGEMRRLFNMPKNMLTGVELKIKNPEDASAVAKRLEEKLGDGFKAVTWSELNHELLAAVHLEKIVSAIIIGIMVIVAALNIICVLVLIVIHRQHEIAILKAIGLANKNLSRILFRGGVSIGVFGVLLGLVLGLLLSWVTGYFKLIPLEAEIYLIKSLPVDISPLICGNIALFCLVVTFLSAYIVAKKLARLEVSEGLKIAK